MNATPSGGSGIQIKNTDHYTNNYADGSVPQWEVGQQELQALGVTTSKYPCVQKGSAYEETLTSANSVNGAEPQNATTVTVDAGTGFAVGDIIEFGDASANFNVAPSGEFYKVTAINTHVLTIARVNPSNPNDLSTNQTGLKDDVVDNARIKRRWEYYYLFDGA